MILNNRGFTLIETVVTAILASIVGAGIFTLLTLQSRHSQNGYGYAELQLRAETVIDAIEIPVRRGAMVSAIGEPFSDIPVSNLDSVVDSFYIYNSSGVITERFRINSGTLEEFIAGSWSAIGNNPITFNSGTLTLSGDRKTVTYSFNFAGTAFRDSLFSLPWSGGVRCRN